jgi:hypothetical protein
VNLTVYLRHWEKGEPHRGNSGRVFGFLHVLNWIPLELLLKKTGLIPSGFAISLSY